MPVDAKPPRSLMAAVMAGEVPDRIPYSLSAPRRVWDDLREELGRDPGEGLDPHGSNRYFVTATKGSHPGVLA